MASGCPDWLSPIVPVTITHEGIPVPVINIEDNPMSNLYGWDADAEAWVKLLSNAEGKLIIDPSEIFEDDPTNNEHGKAPTSNWAYDHKHKPNIHHTPPVAGDFDHDDLSGIGASNHHVKTTLHTEITDFHPAVQDTLSCRGTLVEKAPQLGTNTKIMEMVVFNSKLYGIAYDDGALYEWNDVDAWVEKAPKYTGVVGGYNLCVHDGKLYTGGTYEPYLLEWNDTDAWVKKANGMTAGRNIHTLASFNNVLYAGTNGGAQLWKWDDIDTWDLVVSSYGSEDIITKLIVFDGDLYGTTNPTGYLLKWDGSTSWNRVCQSAGVQQSIESVCEHDGKLYAGTFNLGRLYEWNGVDTLTLKAGQYSGQTYIDSLVSFGGKLYGGSYGDAYLLVWNDVDAWGLSSLCDDVETSITSLCIFNSKLYCGTQVLAKLFVFEQLTLCEFQADKDIHHVKTTKTSEITSGIFDRARLAATTESVVLYDRGNIAAWDYSIGNFTLDAAYHTLNLSSIVPSGANRVLIKVCIRADAADKLAVFKDPDHAGQQNSISCQTQVANVYIYYYGEVGCNTAREIKYKGMAGTFDAFYLIVRGWKK